MPRPPLPLHPPTGQQCCQGQRKTVPCHRPIVMLPNTKWQDQRRQHVSEERHLDLLAAKNSSALCTHRWRSTCAAPSTGPTCTVELTKTLIYWVYRDARSLDPSIKRPEGIIGYPRLLCPEPVVGLGQLPLEPLGPSDQQKIIHTT